MNLTEFMYSNWVKNDGKTQASSLNSYFNASESSFMQN
jgi:hypothetical protein